MAAEFMNILLREKTAELEQEWAREREALEQERAREHEALEQEHEALEQERKALEQERAREREALEQVLEEAVVARFPQAPLSLATSLRRIQRPQTLRDLLILLIKAPDLATVQRAIDEAAPR